MFLSHRILDKHLKDGFQPPEGEIIQRYKRQSDDMNGDLDRQNVGGVDGGVCDADDGAAVTYINRITNSAAAAAANSTLEENIPLTELIVGRNSTRTKSKSIFDHDSDNNSYLEALNTNSKTLSSAAHVFYEVRLVC